MRTRLKVRMTVRTCADEMVDVYEGGYVVVAAGYVCMGLLLRHESVLRVDLYFKVRGHCIIIRRDWCHLVHRRTRTRTGKLSKGFSAATTEPSVASPSVTMMTRDCFAPLPDVTLR